MTDDLTAPDTGGLTLHFDCVAKDPTDLKLEANHRRVWGFLLSGGLFGSGSKGTYC